MLDYRDVHLQLGGRPVLDGFDLRLEAGERVGILGPSGAGKSSLLKLIAGLLPAQGGQCRSDFRHAVLVFQEPRLLPWCRVGENLEIPLRAIGHDAAAARRLALDWLQRVGLEQYAQAWPGQLSGGMAQRVALARAFAVQPDLLLLDEPFSALDPALRGALTQLCREGLEHTGATLLCVSHHPHELIELVDRCVLLDSGRGRCFGIAEPADAEARRATANNLQSVLMNLESSPS
ncbi:MAG: ABC transporter ATP-binding protein [Pseudomonas sp.]|nr:ABC transporter ATP-binding protein [Pseudomonas sp.]